ncbi:hypothetical protein VRU48_11190 [Pedobacter sp. KR3-3]|uniref:WG repeat-containing protein n=1 Tax=Pedobacter albus TaxID=3113905 RepID=A0ABU7I875_9SPHI|nr:hypothetical protein [Pedobacter sp. KR3-3]MEE1945672.1 hypothetical protein [Pedobacter sp. KR3-3]
MHKLKLFVLLLLASNFSMAQQLDNATVLPFNLETLTRLSLRPDSILPSFDGHYFYYKNIKNNQKITEQGFELAYPFNSFDYALIKNGSKFGIIDRNGNLIVDPKQNNFLLSDRLRSYEDYLLVVSEEKSFDLRTGKLASQWIACAEPMAPALFVFSNKHGKYGLKKRKVSDNIEDTVVKPTFDSIYFAGHQIAVAKKKNKIGVVDETGQTLFKFDYDDFLIQGFNSGGRRFPASYSPQFMGLFKNKKWEYYNLEKGKPVAIISFVHRCEILGDLIVKNGLGIFKDDKKYRILYKDGSSSPEAYDWLSSKASVGISNNKVYLIQADGKRYSYY